MTVGMYECVPAWDAPMLYRVPVYDRALRVPVIRYARVRAVDSVTAMRAAVVAGYRAGMDSPVAGEPRRVVVGLDDADAGPNARRATPCKAKGCTVVPTSRETRGYCDAHWEQRQRDLVCVAEGCTTVTSGTGVSGLCPRHSNAANARRPSSYRARPITVREAAS